MSNEIKPVCVIQGPVASRSGYGDHTFSICDALINSNKFDVKIIPMRWAHALTQCLMMKLYQW